MQHHSDRNGDPEHFKRINVARDVLLDPMTRGDHDRSIGVNRVNTRRIDVSFDTFEDDGLDSYHRAVRRDERGEARELKEAQERQRRGQRPRRPKQQPLRPEHEEERSASRESPSFRCYRSLGLEPGTDAATVRRRVLDLMGEAAREKDPVRWETIRWAGELLLGDDLGSIADQAAKRASGKPSTPRGRSSSARTAEGTSKGSTRA